MKIQRYTLAELLIFRANNGIKLEIKYFNEADVAKLEAELDESAKGILKLTETIKYLIGIAERGEKRSIKDGETVESFVLGYVKKLEAELENFKKHSPFKVISLIKELEEFEAENEKLRELLFKEWRINKKNYEIKPYKEASEKELRNIFNEWLEKVLKEDK